MMWFNLQYTYSVLDCYSVGVLCDAREKSNGTWGHGWAVTISVCLRRTMWPGGQDMGKSRNLLSHSSVLHNGGTPTLSRCLWDGHAPSYNCHTDTMTAGEIRTLAKIQKGILMVFVCDYKTNWQQPRMWRGTSLNSNVIYLKVDGLVSAITTSKILNMKIDRCWNWHYGLVWYS